jgi:thioredoxin-dependent peroxiredoxin
MQFFIKNLFLLVVISFYPIQSAEAELRVGDKAPIFSANDQEDNQVDTNNLRGKWVVLYFYPKDDTPGCTIEAKQFTDLYQDFLKNNVSVYGISTDTRESHCDFRDKYKLEIPLIPDVDKRIMSLFDVDVSDGFASRDTIVIDPSGNIAKVYRGVRPSGHPKDVLDFIKEVSD